MIDKSKLDVVIHDYITAQLLWFVYRVNEKGDTVESPSEVFLSDCYYDDIEYKIFKILECLEERIEIFNKSKNGNR